MKLLLCKNVETLGIVGDVVDVSMGYARNYLIPKGLATTPTKGNERRLAEARRLAELERSRLREQMEEWLARLEDVEITIHARANEDGVLYGSVGKKEVAAALAEEGYAVETKHVMLEAPLRQLDNTTVQIRYADDLQATVKVWIVREKHPDDEIEDDEDAEQGDKTQQAGMEAGTGEQRSE